MIIRWLKKWLYGLPEQSNTHLTHEERIRRLREQVKK